MSLNSKVIIGKIESHFLASGLYTWVNTHEPKNPPNDGLGCAIWLQRVRGVDQESGLAKTSAIVTIMARTYTGMIQEPQDEIDPNLGAVTDSMMGRLSGDFTLGGTVRNIDLLNQYEDRFEALTGYVELGGKMYRVIDITIPCIVNDVWDQSAVSV